MTKRFRILPLPLLVLSLAACGGDAGAAASWAGTLDTLASGRVRVTNPERGIWREGEGWRLVEEARIGSAEEEGPALFGWVSDVEADALGRMWVAEAQAHEIRVFEADGRHVRTLGRKGRGPGEFEQLAGLEPDPAGRMWACDTRLARFAVFDTAGALVDEHRRAQGGGFPWRGGFDARGRLYDPGYVIHESGADATLVRYDSAMAPAGTLALPRHQPPTFRQRPGVPAVMWAVVPFAPRQVWGLSRTGGAWMGVADRYELHRVTLEGDTARTVSRPFTPVPVSAAEKDLALAELASFREQGGNVDAGRIPAAKPAFEGLLEDDRGHLWVAPSVPAGSPRAYDVFDPEGRYLGRVSFPRPEKEMAVTSIRGGSVYAVVKDGDGVNYVVRWRIEGRK